MEELQHINVVQSDDQLIKIHLTKRRYKKLLSILPPYPKLIMEKYYGERFGGK